MPFRVTRLQLWDLGEKETNSKKKYPGILTVTIVTSFGGEEWCIRDTFSYRFLPGLGILSQALPPSALKDTEFKFSGVLTSMQAVILLKEMQTAKNIFNGFGGS